MRRPPGRLQNMSQTSPGCRYTRRTRSGSSHSCSRSILRKKCAVRKMSTRRICSVSGRTTGASAGPSLRHCGSTRAFHIISCSASGKISGSGRRTGRRCSLSSAGPLASKPAAAELLRSRGTAVCSAHSVSALPTPSSGRTGMGISSGAVPLFSGGWESATNPCFSGGQKQSSDGRLSQPHHRKPNRIS